MHIPQIHAFICAREIEENAVRPLFCGVETVPESRFHHLTHFRAYIDRKWVRVYNFKYLFPGVLH